MTLRQRRCLDFIIAYCRRNKGVSPSMREIMVAMGLESTSGAHRLVQSLLADGYLEKTEGCRVRNIKPRDPDTASRANRFLQAAASAARALHTRADIDMERRRAFLRAWLAWESEKAAKKDVKVKRASRDPAIKAADLTRMATPADVKVREVLHGLV